MARRITITLVIPGVNDVLTMLHKLTGSEQRPIDNPVLMLRRAASSLLILNSGMACALVISSDFTGATMGHHTAWRIVYAVLFGIAALLSIVYFAYNARLSKAWEFRLRMVMFGITTVAALGWLLLVINSSLFFGGDWARVPLWLFILISARRALTMYTELVDTGAVERVRSHFPDA